MQARSSFCLFLKVIQCLWKTACELRQPRHPKDAAITASLSAAPASPPGRWIGRGLASVLAAKQQFCTQPVPHNAQLTELLHKTNFPGFNWKTTTNDPEAACSTSHYPHFLETYFSVSLIIKEKDYIACITDYSPIFQTWVSKDKAPKSTFSHSNKGALS